MERITRERLYLEHARLEARRSTCSKKQVGCIAVKGGRVIASGYNGVLPGINPDFGIDKDGNTFTVHAEANLVAFAANQGISLQGATLFCTLEPCRKCSELIIQAGIEKVYFHTLYRNHGGLELLVNSIVQVLQIGNRGLNGVTKKLINKKFYAEHLQDSKD